jgi:cytochrome c oxidase assembly factor CtaG
MIAGSLALFAIFYAVGVGRLWTSAGAGRGVRPSEVACAAAGLVALIVALASPLHEWSEELLTAHMIQHELLMVVAAPLMAMGAPFIALLWALPAPTRRRFGSGVQHLRRRTAIAWVFAPGSVFCLHALAIWLWHLPTFYEAAVDDELVHAFQHLSFFLTAALFWWTVLRGTYGRVSYGASVIYIFGTTMQSGLLGALLLLSQRLWYPSYVGSAAWRLTAVEDQQLAGLVMWIPSGIIFTGAGLTFLAGWLRESRRRTGRYDAPSTLLRAVQTGDTAPMTRESAFHNDVSRSFEGHEVSQTTSVRLLDACRPDLDLLAGHGSRWTKTAVAIMAGLHIVQILLAR